MDPSITLVCRAPLILTSAGSVDLGWGGPAHFPEVYELRLRRLLDAVHERNPQAVLVLDVDSGTPSLQLVVPSGGEVRLDPASGSIRVTY
jgi:hypothetical protein